MSSDVAIALGSAFVASILTSFGSLGVASFQAKRQDARDTLRREHERKEARLADERALRDARRERLRRDYEDIAYAADTIAGVAKELGVLFGRETVDARNERLNERLNEATGDIARPILRLRLEEGTGRIIERYQALRAAWFQYADYELPRYEAKLADLSGVIETLGRIESAVTAILDETKADLDRLGKPL